MKKITSVAPGRVCLFGDHQDYLGFPVIAAAIDKYITLEAVPNTRNQFSISMPDVNESRVIDITNEFDLLTSRDYFGSSLKVLRKKDIVPDKGFDIKITGTIPINAGASSSSAIIVAWMNFLVHAFSEDEFTPTSLAELCYDAEVLEHGEPGGMMDQFSISCGNVSFITGQEPFTVEEVSDSISGLILANSGEPKNTIGLLKHVKGYQQKAIQLVKESDLSFDPFLCGEKEIEKYGSILDKTLHPYFYAAMKNHLITQKAYTDIKNGQTNDFSELMNAHHELLKNNLGITTKRIDSIVEIALMNGAEAAKINGSGGGGTVVIYAPGNTSEVIDSLNKNGIEAFEINVSKGAYVH